jgi:hypothetical protein
MKLHLLMYLVNIATDIRNFIKNYNITNRTKFLLYSSDIVEKIQLSVEMIIEMVYGTKDVDLFTKKKYYLLLLEIIREGFKFRELKNLHELGFDFYMEKNVYLQSVLETTEEDYENNLQQIKYIIRVIKSILKFFHFFLGTITFSKFKIKHQERFCYPLIK